MPQIQTDIEQTGSPSATSAQNPAAEDKTKVEPGVSIVYSVDDKAYLTFLQRRLENSRDAKNSPMLEFNGLNYYQDFQRNIEIANTKLPAKKDDDDVLVASGTVEDKANSLLSHLNNLDLSPEVIAYDRDNAMLSDLGTAMTDAIFMTEQVDGGEIGGDEEKKMLRQRELLCQNAVFVQEEWLRKFERKKVLKEKYGGQFKDWKKWDDSLELCFEGPARTLVYGPNVFLGDITEYFMEKQPYVFVAFQESYDLAKTKYGKFENWQYVKAGAIPEDVVMSQRTMYDNNWRLTAIKENSVEVIIYQDKPGDEFQIIINGVLMLPVGFPLSAMSAGGEYSIVKQVFRVISHKFAYGKAFVNSGSIRQISELMDEMLKLFVLKTRKSIAPPYANTSGKVISRKVLSPGKISMGINPDSLRKIGEEGNGVTSNEFMVYKELQDRIDKSTVSPQFQGQQGKSGTTATEIMELQRQAKQTLGLTIFAASMLEKKLAYLRLYNIIQNYFNPFDTRVVGAGDVRKELSMRRKIVRKTHIPGDGMGERHVVPVDSATGLPSEGEIRAMEREMERQTGTPTQMIYLDYEALKSARLRWYIVINPKEKEGSAFFKVLFREELNDMVQMINLGSVPKTEGLEEEFSRVWGKSKDKLFGRREPVQAAAVATEAPGRPGASAKGTAPGAGVPNVAGIMS